MEETRSFVLGLQKYSRFNRREDKLNVTKFTERAKKYLDKHTVLRIVNVIEEELIKKNLTAIINMENSGVIHMLQYKKIEDLVCMYKLFSGVQGGRQAMANCISRNLHNHGNELIKKNDGGDASTFIQNLLDLKDRFLLPFLNTSLFSYDKAFHEMLTSDFTYFVNLKQTSPEYLSLYIDDKLKRGFKDMTEQEVDAILTSTIELLSLLTEKDVFEHYYRKHLAKRILLNKSLSEETEKIVISKLKTEFGLQFTTKLEGMLKDVTISRSIMGEFKDHIAERGVNLYGIDLTVLVLTTGYWPVMSGNPKFTNPSAPGSAFQIFKKLYLTKHSGRKLTLNPQLGFADLNAVFFAPKPNEGDIKKCATTSSSLVGQITGKGIRKHILRVSTYQMCILLLFNNRMKITYEEVKNETAIPEKDLIRALRGLFIGNTSQQILMKHPATQDIDSSHVFYVNDSFDSLFHKVEIRSLAVKADSELQQKETRNNVDEERKHEIEAAIVRIMKTRKTMQHSNLVAEVTDVLKCRFTPDPTLIKKRVEVLIDRAYLSRSAGNRKFYNYVA